MTARLLAACAVGAPYAVFGCNGNKATPTAADAGAIVAKDAESVDAGQDAAGPEAANELEVLRYDDEAPVERVPLTVKTPFANAYRAYPKGDLVTTLKAGTTVIQLAERNGFYRVTFDAPYPPARTLMGWMPKFVFDDATAAAMATDAGPGTKKMPFCNVGLREFLVSQDPAHRDAHCAYFCKDDFECAKASCTCEAAIGLEPSGALTTSAQFTTVCTDAGAPTRDGGKRVPSLYGKPHNVDGTCPPHFVPAPKIGKFCFRSCKTDVDCPNGSTCRMTYTKEAKLCHANNN